MRAYTFAGLADHIDSETPILLAFNVRNGPPPPPPDRASDSKHTIPPRTRFAPIWPLASYSGVISWTRGKTHSPTPIFLRLREATRRALDGERQSDVRADRPVLRKSRDDRR